MLLPSAHMFLDTGPLGRVHMLPDDCYKDVAPQGQALYSIMGEDKGKAYVQVVLGLTIGQPGY